MDRHARQGVVKDVAKNAVRTTARVDAPNAAEGRDPAIDWLRDLGICAVVLIGEALRS